MTETFEVTFVQTLLPQLGLSAIFLLMLWVLWKELNKKIEAKDRIIIETNSDLLIAYKQNISVQRDLKNTIDNNTKSVEKLEQTLSNQVFTLLKEK